MSDALRKDFTTKAKEELTPDATKSTQDKVKETVTDTGDRLGRGTQPDENKGTAQETFDKAQRAVDNEGHGGATNSVADKVKGALGLNNN